MTDLRYGGYPRRTSCSKDGASDGTTRKISDVTLPVLRTVTGRPFEASRRQHAVVKTPPTHVPSG
ncbi:MAG TPA: hypothetical protein VII82_07185, partial [Polyangiaceae bacterium]